MMDGRMLWSRDLNGCPQEDALLLGSESGKRMSSRSGGPHFTDTSE
jgi:hypothetical protein